MKPAPGCRPWAGQPIKSPTSPLSPLSAMPLFWKPYKSDVTQFIETLKQRDPQLEAKQKAGRGLLWDRPQDRQAQADWKQSRVPQQPYVYQTKGE